MSDNFVYNQGYVPAFESWQKTEKRKIRQSGNWIGLSFLGYLLVSTLVANLGYYIYSFINPRAMLLTSALPENIKEIIEVTSYVFSLVIPFAVYMAAIKMPLRVALPFRSAKADITIGGLFVGLGVSILAEYVNALISYLTSFINVGLSMPDYDIPTESESAAVLYSVAMTLFAAIFEEMAFRGCIMQSLRRFGDDFALIASSLIFGIFHLNLIQMPYAFILGIAIGFFVMKTGSLWVGILIHLANNSIALLFEYLADYVDINTYVTVFSVHRIASVVLAAVFVIYFAVRYKKFFQLKPLHSGLSAGKRVWYFISSPLLILGFIIACVLTASYVSFG